MLSDLYACKVLLQVKIVGGAQKTRKVEFASLEHAVRAQNDTPSTHWGGLKRCDSRQDEAGICHNAEGCAVFSCAV